MFILSSHRLRKTGVQVGNVHHIYITSQHILALLQGHPATSTPFYKCPINHSITFRTALIPQWRSQEEYFQVVKETRILHLHISGARGDYQHSTFTALHYKKGRSYKIIFWNFTITNLRQKLRQNTYANKYVRWVISVHHCRWVLLDFHLINPLLNSDHYKMKGDILMN